MDHDLATCPDTLLATLGTARAPQLIDVCVPEDLSVDPWLIPGARHVPHRQIAGMLGLSGPVVVICARGLKLSHGAAAGLRAQGVRATALAGGKAAWAAAGLPRVSLPDAPETHWVLAASVAPASMFHAWLVQRWAGGTPAILWVPAPMTADVADRFDATEVPASRTPADLATALGLDWPPLQAFLHTAPPRLTDLLTALPRLHSTPEAVAQAALHIIDAAWMAQHGAAT
ncbi:MAG: hypothetical protein AAFP16_10215 [Pseudomonadota bacterium]